MRMYQGRNPTASIAAVNAFSAMSFSRASMATYFDANNSLQSAGVNVPRYSGAAQRLLIEGQRTNILLNSSALITQTVTVAATAYTLSFYGTGSVTLSGAATGTLSGTGSGNRVALTVTPTAGSLTLTVAGEVTNAQLEAGAFVSTYIPTTGSSTSRAADIASLALAAGVANAGALVGTFMLPQISASRQGIICLDDGTDAARFGFRVTAGNANITLFRVGGAGTIIGPTAFTMVPKVPFKAAITWDGVDFFACFNSGAINTLSGQRPITNRVLYGVESTTLSGFMFGEMGLSLYNTRLSDAQLQSLTM